MQLPGNEGHNNSLQHLGQSEGQTNPVVWIGMTLLVTLGVFGFIHLFVEGAGWPSRRAEAHGGGGRGARRPGTRE
jgi:hypothetical protein